ncbi:MAG: class I SAM-dependent methyltransferase [Proteobacteria bacterium]|nr:class I SAM-dependent methyltransferase [Pseudomonadota bacterium]
MSKRTIKLDQPLYDYLLEISLREAPILKALREETAADPMHNMQIAPEQGQFMALLAKLIDARRYIEVGVFTGYSSLAVGLALPADGEIIACDVSEEWTSIAKRYWRQAGLEERIHLHLAPADETLQTLLDEGQGERFDFAFIDADKEGYATYYELLLRLIRPGGLIAVDNVLWGGAVIDPDKNDADTEAIRKFNRSLLGDARVDISLVPIGDGLTLARKK